MILISLGGFYYMGKKTEVITQGKKSIFVNLNLAFSIEIGENPPVFS
jgi:hypothetical protein